MLDALDGDEEESSNDEELTDGGRQQNENLGDQYNLTELRKQMTTFKDAVQSLDEH
jgi:hypothetical protein